MGWVRKLFLVVSAAIAAMSSASIRPAQQSYFKPNRDDLLSLAAEHSLPFSPKGPEKPFLYFHVGPTRLDFFALSSSKGDPRTFAAIADEAIRAALGLDLDIKYSRERSFIVLDSDHASNRFGIFSAKRSIDLERLRQVFKSHGLEPAILVRIPHYADSTGLVTKGLRRKGYLYYDATGFGTVVVSESASFGLLIGVLFSCFWPPTAILIGVWLGLRQARNESVDIELRRQRYRKLVYGSGAVGICTHMPIFFWFYGSGKFAVLSDLWAGSDFLETMPGSILCLSFILFSFFLRRVQKDESKLFGTDYEAQIAANRARIRATLPGWIFLLVLILVGVGAGMYIANVMKQPQIGISAMLGSFLLGLVLMTPIEKYLLSRSKR